MLLLVFQALNGKANYRGTVYHPLLLSTLLEILKSPVARKEDRSQLKTQNSSIFSKKTMRMNIPS